MSTEEIVAAITAQVRELLLHTLAGNAQVVEEGLNRLDELRALYRAEIKAAFPSSNQNHNPRL